MRPGPEGNASSSAEPRVTEPGGTVLKKKEENNQKIGVFLGKLWRKKNKKNQKVGTVLAYI